MTSIPILWFFKTTRSFRNCNEPEYFNRSPRPSPLAAAALTLEPSAVSCHDLDVILGRRLPVEAAEDGPHEAVPRLHAEDGLAGPLVHHVLLDGVRQLRVGSFVGVVSVPGRHENHGNPCERSRKYEGNSNRGGYLG